MKSIFSICILLFLFSSASAQDPKFDINDRVFVASDNGANVRDAPQGNLLGTQPIDARGTILEGPVTSANGGIWYRVDFDTGVDGWAGEGSLEEVTDPGAPSVSLTAPANGATVSGTVTVSANASDDEAVLGVQFKIDGGNLGAEDTTSPYAISWNTTAFSEGSYTITAVARDSSSSTTSAPRTVTVDQTPTPPPSQPLSAFPGAEGSGAQALGGRGGAVIMVTNTKNLGSGSLRACIDATGPRTCIFRTSGTIALESGYAPPASKGKLTIAGQSAPGGGIQISAKGTGDPIFKIFTPHTIIRYLRLRHGRSGCPNECGGNVTLITSSSNSIIDHVSAHWNEDEGIGGANGMGPWENITLSWSIIGEGMGVAEEPNRGTGWLFSSGRNKKNETMVNIDAHHILTTNTTHRNPLMRIKSVRLVNNITYNATRYMAVASGGMTVDVISNIFKRGPAGPAQNVYEFGAVDSGSNSLQVLGTPSHFLKGNIGWHQTNPNGDPYAIAARAGSESEPTNFPMPTAWRRSTPLPASPRPITVTPVGQLENLMLPIVGASRRLDCNGNWVMNRDSQDQKVVNQYINNTGTGLPRPKTDETGWGGYPTIAVGVPCPDADLDGMPDAWESARPGLSNSNPGDRNGDLDDDGYTNLEEYLAGPQGGETPPPPPPVSITGKGAIKEFGGGRSATGKVDVKGGPERKPFGRGAVQ